MTILRKTLLSVPLLFAVACSPTQNAYKQNIELFFKSNEDIGVSQDEVSQSSIDLIYITNGNRPVATMALAFIEDGLYKWMSADNGMLITRKGRISKLHGFASDLSYISNSEADPLMQGASIEPGTTWSRNIDVKNKVYGEAHISRFDVKTNVTITINNVDYTVVNVLESVSASHPVNGSSKWNNTFSFDAMSGKLLASKQRLAIDSELIEIEYLSRANRLNQGVTK